MREDRKLKVFGFILGTDVKKATAETTKGSLTP
jgi:hypothetical protein